ncbi:hypothetical protein DFH06DRAFT_1411973 [Mycena polygramma]|nr:hypothetical protein DFH06DRAFT_1411973 [Mycena polygramma]
MADPKPADVEISRPIQPLSQLVLLVSGSTHACTSVHTMVVARFGPLLLAARLAFYVVHISIRRKQQQCASNWGHRFTDLRKKKESHSVWLRRDSNPRHPLTCCAIHEAGGIVYCTTRDSGGVTTPPRSRWKVTVLIGRELWSSQSALEQNFSVVAAGFEPTTSAGWLRKYTNWDSVLHNKLERRCYHYTTHPMEKGTLKAEVGIEPTTPAKYE